MIMNCLWCTSCDKINSILLDFTIKQILANLLLYGKNMKIKPDATRKNSTIRMYEDLLEKLERISEQCNVSKSQFIEGMLADVFENGLNKILLGTGIITVHLSNKITRKHAESVLLENYPEIKNTLYVETDNDETEISVNLNGNEFNHDDVECVFHLILNDMVNLIDG